MAGSLAEALKAAQSANNDLSEMLKNAQKGVGYDGEVRGSDSSLSVAPGTPPEDAARIPRGMVFDPKTGGYVDTSNISERAGRGMGAASSYLSGTPFIGEFVDEGMGRIDSAISGRNPEIMQETFRQSREQFQKSNPKTALGLQVAGGIVGSLPIAAGASGVAGGIQGALPQVVAAGGAGAIAGATEGAMAGYGAGENRQERVDKAKFGGLLGGGLGAAAGAAAPIIGRGAKEVYRRIRGLDIRTISDHFEIGMPAARVVKSALMNDDLGAAAKALSRVGDDAMLADAGAGAGSLLDAASKTGGKALKVTKDAVEGRAAATGARLTATLDDVLGAPEGVKQTARNIAQRTARARSTAYERAYSSAIDYAGDAGKKIEDVLSRIPPKTLKSAIAEANDSMRASGVVNRQILAEVSDNGDVVFKEMPNVQQLDEIKRALGALAQDAVDQFGRPTSAGLRATKLARELRDAISEAVPPYQRAVKLGGDKIDEDRALAIGRKLLSRGTSVEDVKAVMVGASAEARIAAKQGLRSQIEDALSNVKRTITDPNTDAREAMQIIKDMSSRANKAKLSAVLSPSESDRLLGELDKAAAALELRSVVARNSDTAIRQAIQAQVKDEASPGAISMLKQGKILEAGQKIVQALTGATDGSISAAEKQVFDDIAVALTGIKGPDAARALAVVARAMNGQPVKNIEADFVAKVVAETAAVGSYQSGRQYLTTP